MFTTQQRQAATARFERAAATIKSVFDALDKLHNSIETTRTDIHEDPVRDAEQLLIHAPKVQICLDQLRETAAAATEYEKKSAIAAMLHTRAARLFPADRSPMPDPPPPPSWDESD